MVERVLAKDEIRVRFPVAAQREIVAPKFCLVGAALEIKSEASSDLFLACPRSLMDKVSVFGTGDVGSIPAGGTKKF